MPWTTAAQGTSISNLHTVIADMDLPVGTKLKATMNAPGFEWIFDVAGAEFIFQQACPDEIKVIDVYGRYGQGIVDMEVVKTGISSEGIASITIAPLLAGIIAFIAAHWVAILITTVVLATVVTLIVITVKLNVGIAGLPNWLIIGGVTVAAIIIIPRLLKSGGG